MSDSFATPWTVAHQVPLSVGFPRQEYWSGLPFPSPGIFPTHGSHPHLLHWQADPLTLSYLGSPILLLGALYLMDKQGKWASIHCLFGMLMKDILVKTVSSIGLRFQTARSLGHQIWSRSHTWIPEAPVKMPLKFPLREEMSAWHWHIIIPPVHGKLRGWFKRKGWGPKVLLSSQFSPWASRDQQRPSFSPGACKLFILLCKCGRGPVYLCIMSLMKSAG